MTKKEIIQRLFEEKHISFEEMWMLLQPDPQVNISYQPFNVQPFYIPYISPSPNPYNPLEWGPLYQPTTT